MHSVNNVHEQRHTGSEVPAPWGSCVLNAILCAECLKCYIACEKTDGVLGRMAAMPGAHLGESDSMRSEMTSWRAACRCCRSGGSWRLGLRSCLSIAERL